jgi:hypothetical protein
MVMALGLTLVVAGTILGPTVPTGVVDAPLVSLVGLVVFALALLRMIQADMRPHEG